MSEDYTTSVTLWAEHHAFHRRELARLRVVAATITTKTVRASVLQRLQEHARLLGLGDEHGGSE